MATSLPGRRPQALHARMAWMSSRTALEPPPKVGSVAMTQLPGPARTTAARVSDGSRHTTTLDRNGEQSGLKPVARTGPMAVADAAVLTELMMLLSGLKRATTGE